MKSKSTLLIISIFLMSFANLAIGSSMKSSNLSDIPVSGVSISSNKLTLVVGSTVQLVAKIAPEDATNTKLTWASSKPAIATVGESGIVECLSEGATTITVTTVDGLKTATCEIAVGSLDNFDAVNVGNATDGMVKTGGWDNSRVGDLNDDEYMIAQNNGSVEYTFNGTEVAVIGFLAGGDYGASYVMTVDGVEIASGNTSSFNDKFNAVLGFKTGLRAGSHVVKVLRTGGAEWSHFVIVDAIKVSNKPVDVIVNVTGVKLPTTQSLVVGSSVLLPVVVEPSDASNIDLTWTSSNPTVAIVSKTGQVNCLAAGTATITATTVDGGKTATTALKVGSLEGFTAVNIGNASDGMTKSGGWDNAREGDLNGDEYMIAQNIGLIEYNFTGTDVAVIGFLAGPNYGANYTIYVDDDSIASGTTFSTEEKYNAVLGYKGGLESGAHIVQIMRTGGTEWSNFVIVDGLMVKDAPTVVIAKEPSSKLLVFPNPVTNGFLNISMNGFMGNINVSIFNIAGQKVKTDVFVNGGSHQLECSKLKKGFYFVEILGNNFSEVRKIQFQ